MLMVDVNRLKKDGKTKYVKLLGKGILTLVDHLFWNLPFCSVKQSQAVRKKAGVTEEERSTKWDGAGGGGLSTAAIDQQAALYLDNVRTLAAFNGPWLLVRYEDLVAYGSAASAVAAFLGSGEHDLPGAREQLASGWKEYLGKRAGEAARGAGAVRPACLSTVVLDTP